MAPEVIVCETVKDNPYDYKVNRTYYNPLILQLSLIMQLFTYINCNTNYN